MTHAPSQLEPQLDPQAPERSSPPRGVHRRALHRVAAVLALCVAFAFAGQSVAQAASGVQAYQAYALGKLGGNTAQSSCLNQLWQKESGWNPNAQNPSSTAYGIPQFLNSTWASTGIAKTSDPLRQIDAGLIYIKKRYGTPCGAWSFWQSHKWY
ncbi:transglycosylase SLT domain-containing protein [Modestobacter excelsi]|uniref:aggregation-promoting factor C-terminal-like domain-containing protein n=1 Tax=Modestobacter excelsi TaxID=2213161 RepID=UPI001C20D0FB|nr:transglycosylase SLT domain-containing protein [Modestobacter excelsi]